MPAGLTPNFPDSQITKSSDTQARLPHSLSFSVEFEMRKTVAGAHGLGKVTIIYKPKKVKPIWPKILSAMVYPIFLFSLFVSYSWTRTQLRHLVLLPTLKGFFETIDYAKTWWSPARKAVDVNGEGFAVIRGHTVCGAVQEQGYLHAMERSYQMEVYRRAAYGRLSEIFGNKTLSFDRLVRTLGLPDLAQHDLDHLPASSRHLLECYSQGINNYLTREPRVTMPEDFDLTEGLGPHTLQSLQPWQPQHSLAVLRLLLYEQSRGWEDDLMEFLVKKTDELTGASLAKLFASSSRLTVHQEVNGHTLLGALGGWAIAVDGNSSATGSAILAQLYISTTHHQGFWYRNCLYSSGEEEGSDEGRMRACGVSFPGVPLVLSGRSAAVAWSMLAHAQGPDEQLYYSSTSTSFVHSPPEEVKEEEIFVYGVAEAVRVEVVRQSCGVQIQNILPTKYLFRALPEEVDAKIVLCSSFFKQRLSLQPLLQLHFVHEEVGDLMTVLTDLSEMAGLPYRIIYALENGRIGEISPSLKDIVQEEVQGMQAIPRRQPITLQPPSKSSSAPQIIIAGNMETMASLQEHRNLESCRASGLCRLLSLSREEAMEKKVSLEDVRSVLSDTFSPSGYALAQHLLSALESEGAVSDLNHLLRPALQSRVEVVKKALRSFDGRYKARSFVPSLLEGVRAGLLQRLYSVDQLPSTLSMLELNTTLDTLFDGYYADHFSRRNLTALPRLTMADPRIRGLQHLLDDGLVPLPLLLKALASTMTWLSGTFKENIFASPPPSYLSLFMRSSQKTQVEEEEDVVDDEELKWWWWGQVHSVTYPHALTPIAPLQDAVLNKGPEEGAGGLDSVHKTDYVGGPLGHELLSRGSLEVDRHCLRPAFRLLVEMANKRIESVQAEGPGLQSKGSRRPTLLFRMLEEYNQPLRSLMDRLSRLSSSSSSRTATKKEL